MGKPDEHYRHIMARVRAMVFLGTPHRGSAFAELLNNILRTAGSSKVYVSELDRAAPSLQDINDQFRNLCQGVQLASLYETKKTRLGLVKKMVRPSGPQ